MTTEPAKELTPSELRLDRRERERRPKSHLGLAPRAPTQVMAEAVAELERVAGHVNTQMRYALQKLLKSKGDNLDPDDVRDAIERVSRIAATSTTEAKGMALAIGNKVDKFSRRDVRRAIGIDVPEYSSAIGERWRQEHVALITSMSEEAKQRFTTVLRDASKKQTRVETIAKALQEQEGITHRRARLIARDQVLTLNAKLSRDRHKKAGIEEYEWLTVRDGSVRSNHAHLHGKRFRYDKPPMGGGTRKDEPGNPGDGIGCFPGSTPIGITNGVRKAYRRRYSGELTELVLETGETLRATPNHPVLTSVGWKPAQEVNVGDEVFDVANKRLQGLEVDLQNAGPTIEQIFDALQILGATPGAVPGALDQFHGDGALDKDVDVVLADGCLMLDAEPALAQQLYKLVLSDTDTATLQRSHSLAITQALLGAASGDVCGFDLRLTDFLRRLRESDQTSIAAVSGRDTVTAQMVRDCLSRDPVAFTERFNRGALSVEFEAFVLREVFGIMRRSIATLHVDTPSAERLGEVVRMTIEGSGDLCEAAALLKHPLRIVEKRVGKLESHVFNLETRTGWYAADSIAVHNCRCQAIPVIPEFEKAPEKKKPEATKEPAKVKAKPKSKPKAVASPKPVAPVLAPEAQPYFAPLPPPPKPAPPDLQKVRVAAPPPRAIPARPHAASDAVNKIATTAERDAIQTFTGDWYKQMRAAEAGSGDEDLLEKSNAIQRLLGKTEKAGHAYEGTVYRGIADVPEDVVKNFAAHGNEIDLRGTASTSTSLSVAESFAQLDRDFDNGSVIENEAQKGWSVLFRVKNKRGVPIMTMSTAGPGEHEVLQPRNAKFRVTGAFRPPGTKRVLYVDVEGL